MKKAEIRADGDTEMPLDVADCFLWNSPKFISKKTIFPNSLPFSFCLKASLAAASSRTTRQNFQTNFGYSIVKHLKNEKER